MKRSNYPRKLKKAVNGMRASEHVTVPFWGRRSRRRTKWIVRGELQFRKLIDEINRNEARIKKLQAIQKMVDSIIAKY
jgi:hypothetical protein